MSFFWTMSRFKLVFVGDPAVGKTAIVSRFVYDSFEYSYDATIGIDFVSKTVFLDDGEAVRLQIWDTAGQERFRSLVPSYMRDSAVAIVVFDLASRDSFQHVTRWMDDVRDARGQDARIFLVGNKLDIAALRAVSFEEAVEVAREQGVMYMETSAKTSRGVRELFKAIATSMKDDSVYPLTVAAAPVEVEVRLSSDPGTGSSRATGCQCL